MVMGCQGDIHFFSGPEPQLRTELCGHGWLRLGGVERREAGRVRKHPVGAPPRPPHPYPTPGLAGSYPGGLGGQVPKGRD